MHAHDLLNSEDEQARTPQITVDQIGQVYNLLGDIKHRVMGSPVRDTWGCVTS